MLLRNCKVINRVDMASGNSEVYRIDSQEDIVIDKLNSDETCDDQRQDVETNNEISEVEVAVGKEISKEVKSHQKEAVITLDMMQSFMQSIKEMREEMRSIKKIEENQKSFKESQDNLKDSLEKIKESQDNLKDSLIEKMREENKGMKESIEKIERSQDITTMRMEEMQANLREEYRNLRIDNQTNIDRLEGNIINLEERVERRLID